ncbi:hypothetical protein Ciccas_011590 [Cichlidogyrus casuarinus]|uniref:Uncharacterized protein n=1 Tax=Cichlidogyrus casuarinus TaxID=1844966 RepID=A0ABD2PQT8_9PLAT
MITKESFLECIPGDLELREIIKRIGLPPVEIMKFIEDFTPTTHELIREMPSHGDLDQTLAGKPPKIVKLIKKLLVHDPNMRIPAEMALEEEYFIGERRPKFDFQPVDRCYEQEVYTQQEYQGTSFRNHLILLLSTGLIKVYTQQKYQGTSFRNNLILLLSTELIKEFISESFGQDNIFKQ